MSNPRLARERSGLGLVLAVFLGCSVHKAQDLNALQDARALEDFNSQIQVYIAIHHQAEERSGLSAHPEALASAEEIKQRKLMMAKQIAVLRQNTIEGSIFTPELKTYFGRAIDSAYQANPEAAATAAACAPKCDDRIVVANRLYPEHLGFSVMTASMLRRLPQLPEELEYRIVNRDLIIRDREANLIVDVMRKAFPAAPDGDGCND